MSAALGTPAKAEGIRFPGKFAPRFWLAPKFFERCCEAGQKLTLIGPNLATPSFQI